MPMPILLRTTAISEADKETGRNGYGRMYCRYGINSYKSLPRYKFDDAPGWLNEWLQSLIDDSPF
jgi:hypothetical protein